MWRGRRSAADAEPAWALDGRLAFSPRRGILIGADGLVVATGTRALAWAAREQVPVVRLPSSAVILPGLRDPHLHLRAAAAARVSVDCSTAPDIPALLAGLAAQARMTPPGGWVRGWGYDEAMLAQRRAPRRDELDVAGQGHPVVVHHRTGHAAVLNQAALTALGVPPSGPAGGVDPAGVGRDETGRPTGLLIDAQLLLARVPHLEKAVLEQAVDQLMAEFARAGLTAITDATATNDLDTLTQFDRWARDGRVPLRLRAFLAPHAVPDAVAAEVPTLATVGDASHRQDGHPGGCLVAGAKIVAPAADVAQLVGHVRRYGWPVAVHAVDVDQLVAALAAIEQAGPPAWGVDRIEHAGLVLPEQRATLARLGVAVVSNPGFLAHRGSKYLEQLTPTERTWLYPVGSLLQAGVLVAAASDAPVTPADPLATATAAFERTVRVGSGAGTVLGRDERVPARTALALVSTLAARLDGLDVGLRPGAPADVVVVSAPSTTRPGRVAVPTSSRTLPSGVLAAVVGGRPLMLNPRLEVCEPSHRHHLPVPGGVGRSDTPLPHT